MPVHFGHAVLTHPGPNIMINFRQKDLTNAMKDKIGAIETSNAILNMFLSKESKKFHLKTSKEHVEGYKKIKNKNASPESHINERIRDEIFAPQCADEDPRSLDKVFTRLLMQDYHD